MTHSIHDQAKYNLSVIVRDSYSDNVYRLHPETVIWQTHRIASQPGSLEVTVSEGLIDTGITINPGSFIEFGVNGISYFLGNIEDVELVKDTADGAKFSIKAYDHKKLLKSVASRYRPIGTTASDFFAEVMTWFNSDIRSKGDIGISWSVLEPSVARLNDDYFANQTLYSMFKQSMTDTHIAENGNRQYMIRDNLGVLEWRDLQALRKPLVLGDRSFAGSYTYTDTLKDTYNVIRVFRDNQELMMRDIWTKYDRENMQRWRHRQLSIQADEHLTDAEVSNKIDLFLSAKNRRRRTLEMDCAGINGFQAGDGVQARALRASIDHFMWSESVSHIYDLEQHRMSVEFSVY